MGKVAVSMTELGVTEKGWEREKEIYVLSFTSDLRAIDAPRIAEGIAAYNETLPNVIPDISQEALMKVVLMAVSNTFQRIRANQPVSLSGNGIILYPPQDPEGMLASHFVIVEDDEGTRNFGQILEDLLADDSVKALVEKVIAGVSQPLIGALLNALVSTLPGILKKNKNDALFAHSHSGYDWDNYGCRPDETVSEFKLGNDRAYCTLRVTTID